MQHARKQFRAIPCNSVSPPRPEPFFHHQDSSRSSTTRTRAGLSPPGQILSGVRIHKKNKAQPNGLTLFDQTPGRNNFIVRKTRPTGQINNMTMRIILIRSGVKCDRRQREDGVSNTKSKRSPQAERICFAIQTKLSLQNDNHVMTALACKQSRQHLRWPPNKEGPR